MENIRNVLQCTDKIEFMYLGRYSTLLIKPLLINSQNENNLKNTVARDILLSSPKPSVGQVLLM
jgi:hypothetical protein